MKIFLGLFVVASVLSSLAFADSSVQVATVKTFDVSKNWKDLNGLSDGLLEVDDLKNQVTLTLIHSDSSLENVEVTLPIVEKKVTECNVKTIKAYRNRIPVDGPKETILIEDFRSFSCAEVGPLPATRITYEETGGWTPNVYRAQFGATALK